MAAAADHCLSMPIFSYCFRILINREMKISLKNSNDNKFKEFIEVVQCREAPVSKSIYDRHVLINLKPLISCSVCCINI